MARHLIIRPALIDDAAEISRLTTELGYPSTTAQTSSGLASLLSRDDHFVAVAAGPEGHLLGWIAAEHRLLLHYEARAELIGLVVGSDARRRGIGKALVQAAEEWALARRLTGICVRSNAARAESHPFYEGIGYRRNKTQHYYFKKLAGG